MNPERVCENCYQQNKMRQVDEEVGLSFLYLTKGGVTLQFSGDLLRQLFISSSPLLVESAGG